MTNLESNLMNMIIDQRAMHSDNRNKIEQVDHDRANFVSEQQKRINQLHNYLDDKLRCIVRNFDRAVEKDRVVLKNNMSRLDERISDSKVFLTKVQGSRKTFGKENLINKQSLIQ